MSIYSLKKGNKSLGCHSERSEESFEAVDVYCPERSFATLRMTNLWFLCLSLGLGLNNAYGTFPGADPVYDDEDNGCGSGIEGELASKRSHT